MKSITKAQFIALLDAAKITEAQRNALHAEFERKHPEGHAGFLEWLGVSPAEIEKIRANARSNG